MCICWQCQDMLQMLFLLRDLKTFKKGYLLLLYPSLGSARFGSFLARAFGQKARLGSARSLSKEARLEEILKNEPILELEKIIF